MRSISATCCLLLALGASAYSLPQHPALARSTPLPSASPLAPPPLRLGRRLRRRVSRTVVAVAEDYASKIAALLAKGSGSVRPSVKEAAFEWAAMSAAVAVSGGALNDFASSGGYSSAEAIREKLNASTPALERLLNACAKRAPALVAEEEAVLPLARLAVWTDETEWVRPLDQWDGKALIHADEESASGGGGDETQASRALRSLASHLLELWHVPPPLHSALAFRGAKSANAVPEAAHRVAYAFTAAQASAGRGDGSVKAVLQAEVAAQLGSLSEVEEGSSRCTACAAQMRLWAPPLSRKMLET